MTTALAFALVFVTLSFVALLAYQEGSYEKRLRFASRHVKLLEDQLRAALHSASEQVDRGVALRAEKDKAVWESINNYEAAVQAGDAYECIEDALAGLAAEVMAEG